MEFSPLARLVDRLIWVLLVLYLQTKGEGLFLVCLWLFISWPILCFMPALST